MEGLRNLLEPAIEATRRALERMDDEEVPARLRRIAKSSGRRLAAPFAVSVIRELDQSEWLRAKALEHWDEVAGVGGDLEASRAFLERSEGWEAAVESAAEELAEADYLEQVAALERERDSLAEKVQALRGRLEAEKARAGRRLDDEKAAAARKLERSMELPERLRREVARLEAELGESEQTRTQLIAELAEADARIALLLERGVRGAGRRSEESAAALGRGAPLATARTLDRFAQASEPASAVVAGDRLEPVPEMPKGVRPDRPEAVDWLLSLELPTAVMVDGYNLVHAMDLGTDGEARRRTQALLARLRRLAMSPLSVTVFWDSSLGVDTGRGEGVAVAFVDSADDAIVSAAGATDRFVVVVSSDREVRERSERVGASTLWSEALAAWATR